MSAAVMAYHVDFDGGQYTAYCDGCLMQCEAHHRKASRAFALMYDQCATVTHCTVGTREASLVAQGRAQGRPTATGRAPRRRA